MNKKFNKFMKHLQQHMYFEGQIYETKIIDNNKATFRLVPDDYGKEDISEIENLCKSAGYKLKNKFNHDDARTNGYCEYHDITLEKEIDFNNRDVLNEN